MKKGVYGLFNLLNNHINNYEKKKIAYFRDKEKYTSNLLYSIFSVPSDIFANKSICSKRRFITMGKKCSAFAFSIFYCHRIIKLHKYSILPWKTNKQVYETSF